MLNARTLSKGAYCKKLEQTRKKWFTPRKMCKRFIVSSTSRSSDVSPCSNIGAFLLSAAICINAGSANATDKVGEWTASGFIFKDTVEVAELQDPEVPGVSLYISDFKRSIADKLAKDFFSEPSQASLSCALSGSPYVKNKANIEGFEGHEVFSESKGLNIFQDKTLRIRRIYDSKRNTLVYVAYSTRLSTASDDKTVTNGRYRTSICVVPLTSVAPSPLVGAEVEVPASSLN